jgi:hypothetical protein
MIKPSVLERILHYGIGMAIFSYSMGYYIVNLIYSQELYILSFPIFYNSLYYCAKRPCCPWQQVFHVCLPPLHLAMEKMITVLADFARLP